MRMIRRCGFIETRSIQHNPSAGPDVSITLRLLRQEPRNPSILLMDKILHDLKNSKLWELWYIPYNG